MSIREHLASDVWWSPISAALRLWFSSLLFAFAAGAALFGAMLAAATVLASGASIVARACARLKWKRCSEKQGHE